MTILPPKVQLMDEVDFLMRYKELFTAFFWPSRLSHCSRETFLSRLGNQIRVKQGGWSLLHDQWPVELKCGIIPSGCSPNWEHLMVTCCAYYLLRELTSVILTAVHVPPHVDTKKGSDELCKANKHSLEISPAHEMSKVSRVHVHPLPCSAI